MSKFPTLKQNKRSINGEAPGYDVRGITNDLKRLRAENPTVGRWKKMSLNGAKGDALRDAILRSRL